MQTTPALKPEPNIGFHSLELPPPLLQALNDLNFQYCTDIQALALPNILNGKDVAAQAQTGTGKTAAFLLGVFNRLLKSPQDTSDTTEGRAYPRALIIAPTRELAIQIHADASELGKYCSVSIALVYGGTQYEKQRKTLSEGADILIGTPGRLIDYYKQKIFSLRKLNIVVLDEADRMFDLGFISDIRYLLRRTPKAENRQAMLFSATLSHRVMELAYEHMNNPLNLKTQSDSITADGVNQSIYHPASDEKIPLLIGLIKKLEPARSMIFVNTRRNAEKVEAFLRGNDIECGTLSGDVRQKKRQRLLKEFSDGKLPILIATDVAARGLHVDGVSHVFNFDLPQNAEDYVHRIGRTARAGNIGEAISFACEEYAFSLMDIEEYIESTIATASIDESLLSEVLPPLRQSKPRRSANADKRGSSRTRSRRRPPRRQGSPSSGNSQ